MSQRRYINRLHLIWYFIVGIAIIYSVVLVIYQDSSYPNKDVNELITSPIVTPNRPSAAVLITPKPTITDISVVEEAEKSNTDPTMPNVFTTDPAPVSTSFTGTVKPSSLSVRAGPGDAYEVIDYLYQNDVINLLGRNISMTWILVETLSGTKGWVARSQIESSENIDRLSIRLVTPNPITPSPFLTPHSDSCVSMVSITMEGDFVNGSLGPDGESWYSFRHDPARQTGITLLYRPNTSKLEFYVYSESQISPCNPGDANLNPNVGTGELMTTGQESFSNTHKRTWESPNLIPGTLYYVRVINSGTQIADYCLIPRSVSSWMCN